MASRNPLRGAKTQVPGAPAAKTPKRDHTLVSPTSPGLSITDIRSVLAEELIPLHDEFQNIKTSINSVGDKLNKEVETVQESINSVKDHLMSVVEVLEGKVNSLESENAKLKANQASSDIKINLLTERIISLEGHMRRNNLKFLNIKLPTDHGTENCETTVLTLCQDMGIVFEGRAIERAHRTGSIRDSSQPIIVKFNHFKDKIAVLRAKNKFREIGILVVEDFPTEVLEKRKQFKPILQAAYKSEGRFKAKLVADKLQVNGKLYTTSDISKLPPDLQPHHLSTVTKNNITAFFTQDSPLSNHHRCKFTIDHQTFHSTEQFFMFRKALYFHDKDTATKILQTTDPKHAKSLGRKVANFDLSSWSQVCDEIMKTGLYAKFRQNVHLSNFLKGTISRRLAEANPHDSYWGVGLALQDETIWDSSKWKGKNVLGSLLEDLRDTLQRND